jgi:hypothetical protein
MMIKSWQGSNNRQLGRKEPKKGMDGGDDPDLNKIVPTTSSWTVPSSCHHHRQAEPTGFLFGPNLVLLAAACLWADEEEVEDDEDLEGLGRLRGEVIQDLPLRLLPAAAGTALYDQPPTPG